MKYKSKERTMPEIHAFLDHYLSGDQINHFLLTGKEQTKAMTTGKVQLHFVGNNVIWKRR